jgi:hypothetical protein
LSLRLRLLSLVADLGCYRGAIKLDPGSDQSAGPRRFQILAGGLDSKMSFGESAAALFKTITIKGGVFRGAPDPQTVGYFGTCPAPKPAKRLTFNTIISAP